jgi:hypothetical protein
MNIIDLWNSHKEMILYVVKPSVVDVIRTDAESESESGTEGFDSDADADADADTDTVPQFDYATIIEEYFRLQLSVIPNQKRRLVVLF